MSQSTTEKVHLKDGSILVGEILEDNEYFVRIALSNLDDTLKIGYRYIYYIGEQQPPHLRPKRAKKTLIVKKDGIAIDVGLHFEEFGQDGELGLRPELIISKRINNGKMNLGLALDYHNSSFSSQFAWQLREYFGMAAYARYYLTKSKYRLFADGKIGYSLAGSNQNALSTYTSGPSGTLGAGIHMPSKRRRSFLIRVGVDFLQTSGHIESNWNGNAVIDYNEKIISPFLGALLEF